MKSKLTTLLLSLLFACGLWLFVVTVEQPESEQTYYEIPVIYQNNGEDLLKDRGLMIVSERPTITLKLKSTRTNLRNLNESNINILVSLANVTKPGTHPLNYTISYPGNVPASEVSVVSASMEQVSIKVEDRVTKSLTVEVKPVGQVADPQNTKVLDAPEEIELDYPTIDVTGPESVMQNVEKAVVYVDLEGQSQTIAGEFPFTLCDENYNPIMDTAKLTVSPDISAVNVMLKIYKVKEIDLKVKVIPGGGATEATSSINLSPNKLQVYGPESVLEGLEYLEIGVVDLATVTKDETKVFPLTTLPEGVFNNTDTSEVSVDVKFPSLLTRKLSLTNVEFLNLPEGLEAKLNSDSVNVTLRGLAGQMGSLKLSDLTVTVDMADAQVGTVIKSVTVTINSKYPDVGILSISDVYITVTEAEK